MVARLPIDFFPEGRYDGRMNTLISPEDFRAEAERLRSKWRTPEGGVRNSIPRATSTHSQRSRDLDVAQRLLRRAYAAERQAKYAARKAAIIKGQNNRCCYCGTEADLPLRYWGEMVDDQGRLWYGDIQCASAWGRRRAEGMDLSEFEFAYLNDVPCGDTSSDE